MKGIIILANGFEDTEAIVTIDLLRRAKIQIDLVTLSDKYVKTQSNNVIVVENKLSDIKYEDYDFLIIPGGKAVFDILYDDKLVEKVVKDFVTKQKLVCAICAGPKVIGKHGYFENKNFTCFSSCEENIKGNYTNSGVEVCDNFITSKSLAYTVDFALQIIKKIKPEMYDYVNNSIHSRL